MKTILVIGGAGFIGSNLCQNLINENQNYNITSLDNYSTGSEKNHVNGITYIKGSSNNIEDLFIDIRFDTIFHLGEYSRVEESYNEIDKVFNSNINGTVSVLKFCKKNNAKLIYAGSSTKFSDIGPEGSPYSLTKYLNTILVNNYCKWNNMKYAITYFYNAYGNNEISNGKYSTIVAKFKKQYLANKNLTVVKPGTQMRNFTHVDDIISGLIIVAKKGLGDGYGIGNENSISIIELANLFTNKIEYIPERLGNRMDSELNTKKTIELGWVSKINIQNHIKEFKNEKSIN